MQIRALLSTSIKQLSNDEATLEAQILLQYVLNVNRAWLITHADDEISPEDHQTFQSLVARRLNGEPIAYILGEREFYGLLLKGTSDTLIPRPDTETLVEAALKKIMQSTTTILDLGTGTGAIALAIAKHRPLTQVTAVDFSEATLAIAQENAKRLNIPNVTFAKSNWFHALQNQTFDVIVSNPPYIKENDPHLNQGDLCFEPISALAAGKDGLNDMRLIIQQAPTHLEQSGWLMLEHGYNQAPAVAALLKKAGFINIEHAVDLAGTERVTIGRLH